MGNEFSESDKNKMLLWCDRHCCLCGKECGIDIEIAHIIDKSKGGDGSFDNGIPLCYDCHSKVGHYRDDHSRGQKIKPDELKARREQIYENYTRHLVPPIQYYIENPSDSPINLSSPRFVVAHLSDSLPIRALFKIELFSDGESLGLADTENGLYSGKNFWNLNPRLRINGWFPIPKWGQKVNETNRIVARVDATIYDQFERPHKLLPISWVRTPGHSWFTEPGDKYYFNL